MANGTDEKKWKQVMQKQKEEMEEITESFKEFFQNNQELTADELKNFIKGQAQEAESGKVKGDLMKRLSAIESIKGADQLTGEELKEELNRTSQKFHDDMNILSESITKGNELLSSGFSQMTGVLRESFGPVFDLFESGWGVLTGIYNTMLGAFTLIKGIPTLLSSMWGYFKRKEKREMRAGGDGPSIIEQILKGIGILAVGIVGAFVMFTENVTKSFISAFSTIGKIIRSVFINPITRFLSKFKIGQRIIGVFSRISERIKGISGIGGRILSWLGKAANSAGPIIRWASKGAGLLVKLGGFLGRIFLPLTMAYEAVKGLFDPGTVRDKILSASAGMLSAFLKLPEMLINALTSIFGIDFKVDFSKEAIINAVDKLTEWAEKPIHAILDFFTKTIPEYFKKFTDWFKGWKDTIKEKVGGFFDFFGLSGGEEEKGQDKRTSKMPIDVYNIGSYKTGGIVKEGGLANIHPAEVIVPQDLSKKLAKIIDSQDTDSISKYENEKIKLYKQMRDYLRSMMESYQEQVRAAQARENEERRVNNVPIQKEPPDEIESMGLLLFNKSWGLG